MALDYADSSTYLSALVNAGADAMSNLYYVEFSSDLLNDSGEYSDQKVALTVRNSDFKGLSFSHKTQSISFMTVSIDTPSSGMDRPHDVSFSFRLDEHYKLYKYLLAQQAKTSRPSLGYAGTEVPGEGKDSNNFTIRVYAANNPISSMDQEYPDDGKMLPENNRILMYELGHCWVKELSGLDFKNGDDSALTIEAKIGFWDYKVPQDALLKNK